MTLQVQIRQQGGGDVSLEDCAVFSDPLALAIENSGILSNSYVLEVSSPGITEKLSNDRDFKTFRGFPVEVLYKAGNNSSERKTGLLKERSISHVHLNIKGRISQIPREDVLGVRLISPTG